MLYEKNMNQKKIEEKIILENFKKAGKLNFSILETEEAQKIFPLYTDENPDFIINLDGNYIGVDLFMLCMTKSPTSIQYGGKKYINHMQRQSEHPNIVSSIEEFEEYIEKRKKNPEHYPLTRQNNPYGILQERLSRKAGKDKNYVTPKNWLLGFVDQFFNMGIVENIYEDQEVKSYQSLIRTIVGGIEKIDRVILFETGTGPTDKIFEYKNV